MVKLLTRSIAVVGLCVMVTGVRAGMVTYDVSLPTSALIGHPAGPFSVAFQLTDGSGLGDANNTITLSEFNFDGGSAVGSATTLGGVTGSVGSNVVLNDSLFLNFFIQQFNPGDQFSFTVATSDNIDVGATPDEFTFSILDSTGQEIPTETGQPFFNPFAAITINSAVPPLQTFASDPSQSPAGGGSPLTIPAPVATIVPEPASVVLVIGGVLLWGGILRRHSFKPCLAKMALAPNAGVPGPELKELQGQHR